MRLSAAQMGGRRPHDRMTTCATCGAKPLDPCRNWCGLVVKTHASRRRESHQVWTAGYEAGLAEGRAGAC